MGIFDSIFGRKKRPTTPDPVVDPDDFDYQKKVVGADEWTSLKAHVDTGRPILIMGGDFDQKEVIVVSKPTKNARATFRRKSYPVVTFDRVTLGTYESVTFIPDLPKEEIDRRTKLERERRKTAEEEKEEFQKHRYEEAYAPHRYQRSIRKKQQEKPKPAAKPGRTIDEEMEDFPTYRLDAEGNAIQIEKPKPKPKEEPDPSKAFNTNKIPYELRYFKVPNIRYNIGQQRDAFIEQLPPFDLTDEKDYEFSDYVDEVTEKFLDYEATQMLEARTAYHEKRYKDAAIALTTLVTVGYWEPEPYYMLMMMYEESGQSEYLNELRNYAIDFFTKKREKMEQHLRKLGEQQNCPEIAEKYIKEKRKVTYYQGIYDVYDPFPCIKSWKTDKLIYDSCS